MRIEKNQTLDPKFFLLPEINHPKKSYLAATAPVRVEPAAVRGLMSRSSPPRLRAGSEVLGATTGPLDGRALTHGVDARAGEGAGSSAAALHRATMGGFIPCGLRF
jgi:hypothetical protein